MKLYDSIGPNPQIVRMYMAEVGLKCEIIDVNIIDGESRTEDFLAKNSSGQCPVLELDDGTYLSECTVIAEYLDEIHDHTSLIGQTPKQCAQTRMWLRKISIKITEPMSSGFKFAEFHDIFKEKDVRTIPHAADDFKAIAQDNLLWLDKQLEGKEFVCGDRFTLADIFLYCFLYFGEQVGQPLDLAHTNVGELYKKLQGRPSAVETSVPLSLG